MRNANEFTALRYFERLSGTEHGSRRRGCAPWRACTPSINACASTFPSITTCIQLSSNRLKSPCPSLRAGCRHPATRIQDQAERWHTSRAAAPTRDSAVGQAATGAAYRNLIVCKCPHAANISHEGMKCFGNVHLQAHST